MSKAHHFAPPLLVLFLGCTILSGGAQAGWFDSDKPQAKPAQPEAKAKAAGPAVPSANLEESIRQAQLLRLAGSYPEAVKHLSQLMMVAADDPRVVSEYGKTLAQMGRASDAMNFLTRASQLSPTDWTVYSALGVAYDEVGNQKQAQSAYEHALTLKPGEPSVLNNYALSRLLAKDTDMARTLAGRAEAANATDKDDKIARNIAMIRSMAPATAPSVAVNKPSPAPTAPMAQQILARPLAPQKVTQAPLPAPSALEGRVVMQRVPVDPLAGPVANQAPRPLQPAAKIDAPKAETPKPPSKPDMVKALPARPAEPANAVAKAEPAAKPVAKPVATAIAKTEVAGPVVKIDLAPAKPDVVKQAPATKPEVKLADAKPAMPVVKAASVKPTKADGKTDTKDAIPGLRLSANAF